MAHGRRLGETVRAVFRRSGGTAATVLLAAAVVIAALAFSKGVPAQPPPPCQNVGVSYDQALCVRGQSLVLQQREPAAKRADGSRAP